MIYAAPTESIATELAPTALVVDDDDDMRESVAAVLELAGFDVARACDGSEAVARCAAARPDIVLMDVRMPRMDGFSACRALRELPDGGDLPIVLSTGSDDVDSINRAYECGATDFVTKPINWLLLEHRMRYILRASRAILDRRHAERALLDKNAELERLRDTLEEKVGERTSDLEIANHELKRLNRIRSEFVSHVSHELRTPLTSIKSFAELLMDDRHGADPPTRVKYLRVIDQESDRLARLISDLLDLQKMDAGKMPWRDQVVDLGQLLSAQVEQFGPAFRGKGLALTLRGDAGSHRVRADPDRLGQVFTNLLSNAQKFTAEGGASVSLARLGADRARIGRDAVRASVADSGPGIPAEQLERVFDTFHQLAETQHQSLGGSGLGLSICLRIVGHYEGRIWAECGPAGGAVLTVELPAAGPAAGPRTAA